MKWEEIDGSVWHIPSEEREKGNAGDLELPQVALDIINAQTTFRQQSLRSRWSWRWTLQRVQRRQEAFDAKVPIPHWTIHDLRRTARSLMSRAGVRPDIAERTLGHAIRRRRGHLRQARATGGEGGCVGRPAGLIENILSYLGGQRRALGSGTMTKLPPGRPSFPYHPTGFVKILEGKNQKHTLRWLMVRQQRDICPEQTWEETFQAVADMESTSKRNVAWPTIESSFRKVESAIKNGEGHKFFISDWPPDTEIRVGAKKRPDISPTSRQKLA